MGCDLGLKSADRRGPLSCRSRNSRNSVREVLALVSIVFRRPCHQLIWRPQENTTWRASTAKSRSGVGSPTLSWRGNFSPISHYSAGMKVSVKAQHPGQIVFCRRADSGFDHVSDTKDHGFVGILS